MILVGVVVNPPLILQPALVMIILLSFLPRRLALIIGVGVVMVFLGGWLFTTATDMAMSPDYQIAVMLLGALLWMLGLAGSALVGLSELTRIQEEGTQLYTRTALR
jgi:hypothetical protein